MLRYKMMSILFLILASSVVQYISANLDYRLPATIQPEHYQVKLVHHLEDAKNLTFYGEVAIRFQILSDTRNITLNFGNLEIDDSRIELNSFDDPKFSLCLAGVDRERRQDFYVIRLCQTLFEGQTYEVKLYFSGDFESSSAGYVYQSYVGQTTNATHKYTATLGFPNGAQFIFPCFAEPSYKAKFTIWLGHHESLKAVSNMPLEKQTPIEGFSDFVWSIFEESPPMPTSSVAFTLNDFDYKESQIQGSDVVVRTWCSSDFIKHCESTSKKIASLLKRYEELYGIAYPLKKLDLIVIPHRQQFTAGTWGIIINDERLIKNDYRVGFDLAYQWFGNLVTPTWWSDYWLYNSLAIFMSGLAQDYVVYYQVGIDLLYNMKIPEDVGSAWTVRSYKGYYTLRMVHAMMGQKEFTEAIRDILIRYQYKNVDENDFWNVLDEKAHKYNRINPGVHMKTFIDSWLTQNSYPVINITRNYDTGSVEISQYFYVSHYNLDKDVPDTCWWIPLSYTTASQANFSNATAKVWLECDDMGKSVPLKLQDIADSNEWMIFNLNATVISKVLYDEVNWRFIGEALRSDRFKEIPDTNRLQIVEDICTFEENGDISYTTALGVLEYLVNERTSQPWQLPLEGFKRVFGLLRSYPEHQAYFKSYMRYIIEPIYYHMGGLNATVDDNQNWLKYPIAAFACKLELIDCVQTALAHFQKWKFSENPDYGNDIPDTIKSTVYEVAVREGDESDWNFLWQLYNKGYDIHAIISALGCSRNKAVLKKFIDIIFDKDTKFVHLSDRSHAVRGIMECSHVGASLVWNYVAERMSEIRIDFAEQVDRALTGYKLFIGTTDGRKEFSSFIESNKEYLININNLFFDYHYIDTNIAWMERNLDELIPFIKNRLTSIGILDVVESSLHTN